VAKRIAPERLWQDGKWLLVPMQDEQQGAERAGDWP
jgi:hypothetical protein